MNKEQVKEFGKKHWKKAAVLGGAIALVTYGCLTKRNGSCHPDWTELKDVGGKVINAHKWNGKDEFNGCITACVENVTMDEFAEVGKELLVKNGMDANTNVKAVRFLTEGVSKT